YLHLAEQEQQKHLKQRALGSELLAGAADHLAANRSELARPVKLPRRHLVIWLRVNVEWIHGADSQAVQRHKQQSEAVRALSTAGRLANMQRRTDHYFPVAVA
ncbi:unnamed protein product, partial [Urochloa humidicola]